MKKKGSGSKQNVIPRLNNRLTERMSIVVSIRPNWFIGTAASLYNIPFLRLTKNDKGQNRI